ncbi:MAG: PrsW family glutamic-type intramembrane protease [Halobacteria archaeon]
MKNSTRNIAVIYGVVLAAGVVTIIPVLKHIEPAVFTSPAYLISITVPFFVVAITLIAQNELSPGVIIWGSALGVLLSSIPLFLNQQLSVIAPEGSIQSLMVFTPGTEELVKGLAVALAGIGVKKKSSGLALGAVSGFGFAAFENSVLLSVNLFFLHGVARVSVSTIHVITGAVFGYYLISSKETEKTYLTTLKGYLLAWLLHAGNNAVSLMPSSAVRKAIALGLITASFLVFLHLLDWRELIGLKSGAL